MGFVDIRKKMARLSGLAPNRHFSYLKTLPTDSPSRVRYLDRRAQRGACLVKVPSNAHLFLYIYKGIIRGFYLFSAEFISWLGCAVSTEDLTKAPLV